MTVAEKKIEMVQRLLLLQDKSVLFEIDKLIEQAFQSQHPDVDPPAPAAEKTPVTFDAWVAQFEHVEPSDTEDELGMTPDEFRQRIWAAEQSEEMSLETFWKRVVQN